MGVYKILDKDILYDMYINQNLGIPEICKLLQVGSKVVKRNLSSYNIVKSPELYEQYRHRITLQRVQYCEDKYGGNGFASKELKQKAIDTYNEKYNTDIKESEWGFQNSNIQKKAQNTIKDKYRSK